MACNRVEGPDFICIGMAKAGTGWLFDQLQHHPDFWMPPVKEIRYLNRSVPKLETAKEKLERIRDRKGPSALSIANADPKVAFLQEAVSLADQPMNLRKYASLFRFKGDLLSGDITPGYNRLGEAIIGELARELPKVKVILLVRDPISRAWSHLSMLSRQNKLDASTLNNAAKFTDFFVASNMRDASFPTEIAKRWSSFAELGQFRYFFFDEIVAEPDKARHDILCYLGGEPTKGSWGLPAGFNRKASKAKVVLTEPVRAVLVEQFKDEIRACAEIFGGYAIEWAAQYGI
jgi:hypothetical protein